MLAAENKAHQPRDESRTTTHERASDGMADLVEDLPPKLERVLIENLQPGERVLIKLRGVFKEGLVCTDRRVLILKTGFMTHHFFGASVWQLPYRLIAGATVNTHLLSGYFELSSGGEQNIPTSYWGRDGASARENCVSLRRDLFERFRRAAAFITMRAAK